jgi:hypothetical protein
MQAVVDFALATADIVNALRADGAGGDRPAGTARRSPGSRGVDPVDGHASTVELGVDWRAHPPVQMDIGPVPHPSDAVANKNLALFGVRR